MIRITSRFDLSIRINIEILQTIKATKLELSMQILYITYLLKLVAFVNIFPLT